MDSPQRRAVGALAAGLLGFGSLLAQDAGIPPTGTGVPKIMPPRSGAPVTVTVSPYGNTPLPPTGVPVGTPIPVGIPPGTQIKSIPLSHGTPTPVETTIPNALMPLPVSASPIQSPYFGYYPTQWRTFPDQAFPLCPTPSQALPGQALPTYPPNMTSSDTPPLLRVTPPKNVPSPLPMAVQSPAETVTRPTPPPLLPFEEVRAAAMPLETKPAEDLLAKMGRPRLSSIPDPITPVSAPPLVLPPIEPVQHGPILPTPSSKDTLIPASAIEIPFVPAPTIPTPVDSTFGIEQPSTPKAPLKIRPPTEPKRPKFSEDSTVRPAPPVIRAGGTGG